jgi:predicted Zn-dependent protease
LTSCLPFAGGALLCFVEVLHLHVQKWSSVGSTLRTVAFFACLPFRSVRAEQLSPMPVWKNPQQAHLARFNKQLHLRLVPNTPQRSEVPLTDGNSCSTNTTRESQADDYLSEIAADGLSRWVPERFPIRVYIEPGKRISGYRLDFKNVLTSSFDQWCQASAGYLSWCEVNGKDHADLVCRWIDQAPEQALGIEAGRTRLSVILNTSTNRGVIKHATMDLLTSPPDREFTDDEIKKAYLHECGHAFGLSGHSSQRADIMTAVVTKEQPISLSRRDIASIRRLYAGYPLYQKQAAVPSTTVQSSSAVSRNSILPLKSWHSGT